MRVTWAAAVVVWRSRLRRAMTRARPRGATASALLVVAGLAGALLGGWLVARWCLGLVLIAESCGALAVGLLRDDGAVLPRAGEKTVADVLESVRRLP